MVYCGSTRALCQLERRVHANGSAPKDMALLRLEIPDVAAIADVSSVLPPDWKSNQAATQLLGMQWLKGGNSLGMWVPSFVEPAERNLLLNPSHADYGSIAIVVEQNPFLFDPRLFS